MTFSSEFDAALAAAGFPAVFTLDPRGRMRLADDRTRDSWGRCPRPGPGACHCLFRDRATGFVQYVLTTSPDFCRDHPRAEVVVYPGEDAALAALAALGSPPVRREALGG